MCHACTQTPSRHLCHSCTRVSRPRCPDRGSCVMMLGSPRCDSVRSRRASVRGCPLTIGTDASQPRPWRSPSAHGMSGGTEDPAGRPACLCRDRTVIARGALRLICRTSAFSVAPEAFPLDRLLSLAPTGGTKRVRRAFHGQRGLTCLESFSKCRPRVVVGPNCLGIFSKTRRLVVVGLTCLLRFSKCRPRTVQH